MVSGRIERDGGREREKGKDCVDNRGTSFCIIRRLSTCSVPFGKGGIRVAWKEVEGRKEGGAVVEESWKGLEERGSSRRGVCPKLGGVANRACKHAHAAFPWDEAALYARYNTALKTYTLLPFS